MPDPGGDNADFFISRAGADADWAVWIAWVLEEAGYAVIVQDWDFRPGKSFLRSMQEGATLARRTLAVLSPAYLASPYTTMEWEAAIINDPTGAVGGLTTVRVRECQLEGLLARYPYVDLVGKLQGEARDELLKGIALGRRKPQSAPAFPGPVDTPPPAFPGPDDPPRERRPSAGPPSAEETELAVTRAGALLPNRSPGSGTLVVALAVGEKGEAIRPSVLASDTFAQRVYVTAISSKPPVLTASDTTSRTSEGVLTVQQRMASVSVTADGSIRVIGPAYQGSTDFTTATLPGLIEEDVAERIAAALAFAASLGAELRDGGAGIGAVAAAAAIYGAHGLGWRTRAQRDASGGRSMSLRLQGSGDAIAGPRPMSFDALRSGIDEAAADLTALLAEQLRP